MKYIGAHVSIAGGVENAPVNAAKIGAKAFAMFTKNQRQWKAKPLSKENISKFKENLDLSGIKQQHVLCHDSYLINLGNPDAEKRVKSLAAFIDEATRVEQLGLTLFNFHPGSHLREITEKACMDLIAAGVQEAMKVTEQVVFVLENTAGQGSNVGFSFEQLAYMLEKISNESRTGVCIDTCHLFAAGYDLKDDYDGVMQSFAEIIGFDKLKGVHLNDAKSKLGQKLDRHHSIGRGNLGFDVFQRMMQDTRFDDIPLILETIDSDLWPEEIRTLYSYV